MESLLLILPITILYDFKTGKVPNELLLPIALGGPVQMVLTGRIGMAGDGIVGLVLFLVLLFPFYLLGGIGAGDVKILMFLPGYFPRSQWLELFFVAFGAGALLGIGKCIVWMIRKEGRSRSEECVDCVMPKQFPMGKIHFTFPIWISVVLMSMR